MEKQCSKSAPQDRRRWSGPGLAFALLCLAACGSEQDTVLHSCVAKYADRPCELLTPDLFHAHYPDAPRELEPRARNRLFTACLYRWPSERSRVQEFAGRRVQIPEDNTVRLTHIESYADWPRERFRRAYLPTATELRRAQGLEEDAAGQGVPDNRFSAVPDLGDLAAWGAIGDGHLYVLSGATKFEITSNISADPDADRASAVALARSLMESCRVADDAEEPEAQDSAD